MKSAKIALFSLKKASLTVHVCEFYMTCVGMIRIIRALIKQKIINDSVNEIGRGKKFSSFSLPLSETIHSKTCLKVGNKNDYVI